jgi:hypothetical protein
MQLGKTNEIFLVIEQRDTEVRALKIVSNIVRLEFSSDASG